MTPEQRKLARHALGLPNGQKRSYRNRFYAAVGSEDEARWIGPCAQGMAVRSPCSSPTLIFFCLTRKGAESALAKGEKLDLEDFPEEAAP
jgi:hypothetical protein